MSNGFTLLIFMWSCLLLVEAIPWSQECNPGEEEVKEGNNTCRPCEVDHYSIDGKICYRCKQCKGGQEETTKCFPTQNRRCLCTTGKYLRNGVCTICDDCVLGFRQISKCIFNRNRACEECNPGFTTMYPNSRQCVPRNKQTDDMTDDSPVKHNNNLSILLASFLLPMISLFALLMYFITKFRRVSKNDENVSTPLKEDIPMDSIDGVTVDGFFKIEDLNAGIPEQISIKLNPKVEGRKNWEDLARKSDIFKNGNISEKQMINNIRESQNPTYEFLKYYGTTENATVRELCRLLKSIRRNSTAGLLEETGFVDFEA